MRKLPPVASPPVPSLYGDIIIGTCMYVCMFSHHLHSSRVLYCIVQPYMITNPARGQLNREIVFFFCLVSRLIILPRETGSPVPSRLSPLILNTQAKFGANLRDSSRFPRRCLSMPSRPVPSLSGHAFAYRWSSLPNVRWHKVVPVTGAAFSGFKMDRFISAPIFPHLLVVS